MPLKVDRIVLRPHLARDIHKRVSGQFLEFFGRGLTVIGFERTEDAGVYLLGQWEGDHAAKD